MNEQTNPAGTPQTFHIHFDYFPAAAAFACAICDTAFRAHVVPRRYPTGDIEAGRWICRPCLAAGSPRLASISEALELIAVAGAGTDEALALAQQTLSTIRRVTETRAVGAMAIELYGPDIKPPAIVDLGVTSVTDDSDLFVGAYLADGKPQVTLADRGGWAFLDADPDTAAEVANRVRDFAEVARMAAQFGPGAGPADPDDEVG
ncbi:hypothetical protein [Frankia tisae]|uniref:hypothetical protein n=1 Tax=Frankia tisae TaxID=2950104 RepID=UPI0021BE3500|nr:hypothetical protein [Frankia tisae]